jgi:hypothetical protein
MPTMLPVPPMSFWMYIDPDGVCDVRARLWPASADEANGP